ncbi:hypothetical protein [Undibacterium sp. Xuan67W]|uniref:hypothetical protein n=1 Tax=Undibacterium sp. Xuan67W TaxID=3413057 RepID=UPI003BF2ECF9
MQSKHTSYIPTIETLVFMWTCSQYQPESRMGIAESVMEFLKITTLKNRIDGTDIEIKTSHHRGTEQKQE